MADHGHEHAHKEEQHGQHGHAHDGDCCGHDHGHEEHAHGHKEQQHEHGHDGGDDEVEDQPLPPISWKVVSYIYAGGSVVCGAFATAHYVFDVDTVKGFWLIFAFFPLCLLYSLFKWQQQSTGEKLAKKFQ